MSVFIEVEHVTTYRYAKPVEFSNHKVMFRPRAAHDIRVLRTSLEVSPLARQHWIQDVFSNSVALVELLEPAQELRFNARFTIEHFGVRNLELPVDPEAQNYPFEYKVDDRIDLAPFLPPQYPKDAPGVSDWVKQFMPARGVIQTRDILRNISEGIRSDFAYASREAMGTQRPAETLSLRGGTCRDFALLMIEAARGLGLAARFVSGYLYDPSLDGSLPVEVGSGLQQGVRQSESFDAEVDTRGAGATHAWLHVYLPGAGWVPFDPTNTLFGGTDLIRVAYTRTPEQAAPISGGWTGSASDYLGMTVRVNVRRIDAEQAAADAEDPSGEP
ncbi:transglutaminase N-terminal domain-containing protein [Thiocapsa sp.]|uniref:transglutaminase family protein n=1 Tax=Thiocapsa sp. TaxID=2024551 RepID=UPI003593BD37